MKGKRVLNTHIQLVNNNKNNSDSITSSSSSKIYSSLYGHVCCFCLTVALARSRPICGCYLLSFVYELEIRRILNVAKRASKKLVDCAHQSDISMIFFLLLLAFLRSLYSMCTILCVVSLYINPPIYPRA